MGPRVTTLTNTKDMLKADLEAVKQELASEKLEKIKHQNAWIIQNEVVQNLRQVIIKLQEMYENTKDAWIAKNEEVQNLCQVISRSVLKLWGLKLLIVNCLSKDTSKVRGVKFMPSYLQFSFKVMGSTN